MRFEQSSVLHTKQNQLLTICNGYVNKTARIRVEPSVFQLHFNFYGIERSAVFLCKLLEMIYAHAS